MKYQVQNHLGIAYDEHFEPNDAEFDDEFTAILLRDGLNQAHGREEFSVVEIGEDGDE